MVRSVHPLPPAGGRTFHTHCNTFTPGAVPALVISLSGHTAMKPRAQPHAVLPHCTAAAGGADHFSCLSLQLAHQLVHSLQSLGQHTLQPEREVGTARNRSSRHNWERKGTHRQCHQAMLGYLLPHRPVPARAWTCPASRSSPRSSRASRLAASSSSSRRATASSADSC